MTINSLETVYYTLAFLVPGFLFHSTVSLFIPRRAEPPQVSFLRFLSLSCINYAVWSWLVYLILYAEFFQLHPVRSAIAWAVIILPSPIALGMLLGHWRQTDLVRRALQRFGFSPIHDIPTGWDYFFSRVEDAVWVLVTLTDGSEVAGLFGTKSLASSEPNERDLYIQEVFTIDDEGNWNRAPRTGGILIRAEHIRHIEFRTHE